MRDERDEWPKPSKCRANIRTFVRSVRMHGLSDFDVQVFDSWQLHIRVRLRPVQ